MRHRRRSFRHVRLPTANTEVCQQRGDLSLHAENNAAAAELSDRTAAPLVTLLTQHILRDGELIILAMRPSAWFIPLVCLRFIGAVLILLVASRIFSDQLSPRATATILEVGVLLIVTRLMFAVLQWSGQLYVLTELRILRLSGVFSSDIFDCPLRKVARTRLLKTTRERLCGVGSIEIIPYAEDAFVGVWQTVPRPREVHRIILSTIARAKQGPNWMDPR